MQGFQTPILRKLNEAQHKEFHALCVAVNGAAPTEPAKGPAGGLHFSAGECPELAT